MKIIKLFRGKVRNCFRIRVMKWKWVVLKCTCVRGSVKFCDVYFISTRWSTRCTSTKEANPGFDFMAFSRTQIIFIVFESSFSIAPQITLPLLYHQKSGVELFDVCFAQIWKNLLIDYQWFLKCLLTMLHSNI